MKAKVLIIAIFVFMLPMVAIAEKNKGAMSVDSFANTLIAKLGLSDQMTEGMKFEEITGILPEAISTQLAQLKGKDSVSRQIVVGILAPYLPPEEVEAILSAGNPDDILEDWEIHAILDKCAYEGGILTFIRPPAYGFTDVLETKLADIDEVPVSGE